MVPRRISRAVLLLGLALSGMVAIAPPCLACDCVAMTPKEALRGADAAFVGQVVQDVMTAEGTTQTFEVEGVFKGELGPTVDVWAQIGTEVVDTCAVLYPTGDRVAVLLTDDGDGRWSTQICATITEAALRRLAGPPGEPVAEASPSPPPPPSVVPAGSLDGPATDDGLPAWAVIALGAFVAVAVVGAQIVWAGRRDRRAAYPSGWDPVDVDEPRETPQEVEP